ncbi:ATP-binding cassette domain-containing protein [Vibrio chagasii]|nr:ATP-binding cassette domain-containing protein [Vibrio chagasii]
MLPRRSGCGKTTVLRYLAGLLGDKVEWQGVLAASDELPLTDRIAYMAQQDLLLPWLSVIDNVCLSHRFQNTTNKHLNTEQRTKRSSYSLRLVWLITRILCRISCLVVCANVLAARTLMQDKPVVLMDEPFSALDAVTRHKLQSLAYELVEIKPLC